MNRFFSLILLLILVYSCCLPSEYVFSLENNSDHNIGDYLSLIYPDTSLPQDDKLVNKERDWERFGPAPLYETLTHLSSEQAIIHKMNPNDTVSIFIFHTDTLKMYPWETIRDDYKILVRYDLSADDINSMPRDSYHGYLIPFPPSPQMENMHMYPPYKEVIARYGE